MAFNQFPVKGGIPGGNTAARPSSPVIGDTYYNGQKGYLEIYNGTTWLVASAVPGAPSVTVTDVGTSRPYGSAQASIAITAPTNGGSVDNYIITASNTSASYTTSSTTATTVTLTAGNGGAYNVSAYAINGFGNSASFNTVPSITTVPGAPVLSQSASTATTITVAITVDNGGKAISNYQYSFDGSTYTAFSPAQSSTSSVTFTGLTASTTYTIYLKAVNANGVSTASSVLNAGTAWAWDYVVVGGGAGATGYYYSGGAGSGSMLTGSVDGVLNQAYLVTVGAGGAQQVGPGGDGNPGVQSRIGSVIAPGGRGAAASAPLSTYQGGTIASSSQGGGSGGHAADSQTTSGGGGGAGAAGTAGSSGGATGNGGVGVSTSISGSSVFYAGGGGGSSYNVGSRGSGGNGGGGNGTDGSDQGGGPTLGSAGSTNTGGGGGGASHPAFGAAYGYGFAGGSGRVIIKAPSGYTATFSGGVTQTNTTSSGFKIYQITAAGTSDTVTFSS
jgi:hypothetical protein